MLIINEDKIFMNFTIIKVLTLTGCKVLKNVFILN